MADEKKPPSEGEADPAALRDWVSKARAISALIGFGIAYIVASRAGLSMADAALRGVIAAAIFSVVGWWCALLVIHALMRAAAARRVANADAAMEELRRRREAEAAAPPAGEPALPPSPDAGG